MRPINAGVLGAVLGCALTVAALFLLGAQTAGPMQPSSDPPALAATGDPNVGSMSPDAMFSEIVDKAGSERIKVVFQRISTDLAALALVERPAATVALHLSEGGTAQDAAKGKRPS